MASCVVVVVVVVLSLVSLVSWLFAAAFSLFFFLSFYEQCEKKKAASPHPERTNLCFFFRCSRDFFLCVINSSIVGGFDLEVVV